VWKQNRSNAKNRKCLNSLAAGNNKNKRNAAGIRENVVHPCFKKSVILVLTGVLLARFRTGKHSKNYKFYFEKEIAGFITFKKLQASIFSAPPTPFNVKWWQSASNSSSAFRTVLWMMPNISFVITDFIIILTNENNKNVSITFSTNAIKTNYSHQVNSLPDQRYFATVIAVSHGVLSSPSTSTDVWFKGNKYT